MHGDGVSVKKSRIFKQTDDLQPVSPLLNNLHTGSGWLWALRYRYQYFLGMVESNRRTHPQNLGPVSIQLLHANPGNAFQVKGAGRCALCDGA